MFPSYYVKYGIELFLRKKLNFNISHKAKSVFSFLKSLSSEATGENMIIISTYAHDVLLSKNTSNLEFSFNVLNEFSVNNKDNRIR